MNELDQDAVNLAKAIRQVESGGSVKALGQSGEKGAYQFMPETWTSYSKQAGINAPLEQATLEQQNQVAYHKVKQWKDRGYNPGQIASMWNAGEGKPNAYKENYRGTNEKGVAYDTPKYAQQVAEVYQSLKGQRQGGGYVNPLAPQVAQASTGNGFVQPPSIEAPRSATPMPQPQQDNGLMGKLLGGAGSLYNSVASPFVGLAAAPLQAGVAGYNALTGSNIEDPFKQGIPSIAGENKNTPVTPLGLEQKAGDAAQVGSYFVPGSGVLGAAGMGALQGAGSAMSAGKDLPTVVTSGALGSVVGAGTALATKAVGAGISKAGDLLSGASKIKAIEGIKEAYTKALNLPASQRAMENRTGKDLARVLMENQVPLSRYDDGTLDASQAIPLLQEKLAPLNAKVDEMLNRPQGVVPDVVLPDVLKSVKDRIASMTMAEADKGILQKSATDYLKAEIKRYGNTITPAIADKIKQGFWAAVGKGFDRDTVLREKATYLLGSALKDATEQAVAKTDTTGNLGLLNAQRGELIDAIHRLTKLDGVQKVIGGKLGNMAGGLTGTVIGSTMGPIGGLAGDYFGTKAAQFLNDPATRIAIAGMKSKSAGLMPSLLGSASKPVGGAISATGELIKKAARPAGLIGNLLTNIK